MDKLIRVAIGIVVIVVTIAVVYGLALLHIALGFSNTHYMYVGAAFFVSYIAYILGDIALVAYDSRGKK